MNTVINLAQDFSDVPAGRFISDGPYSGEAFREAHLKTALERSGDVTVNLNGSEGYGASFLEEAFGGLVREYGYTGDELRERMRLVSEDPTLIEEVWRYIDRAMPGSH